MSHRLTHLAVTHAIREVGDGLKRIDLTGHLCNLPECVLSLFDVRDRHQGQSVPHWGDGCGNPDGSRG